MNAITRPMLLILALLPGLFACTPKTAERPLLRLAGTDVKEASFDRAKQLVDRGKAAEAITVFRTLLREDGPSLPVLNGLAIAHAELGRPDLAADHFARALMIAPDDPATLNNIGYAALRRDETGLARLYLERAEQAGGGVLKISGNLEVLKRLEAWMPPRITDARSLPRSSAGALFTVQRRTASTVRLSGLQTIPDDPGQRQGPSSSSMMLIDFAELFDPYPAPPSDAALIDFDGPFDGGPTSDRRAEPPS